jgi:hypothetical protein
MLNAEMFNDYNYINPLLCADGYVPVGHLYYVSYATCSNETLSRVGLGKSCSVVLETTHRAFFRIAFIDL